MCSMRLGCALLLTLLMASGLSGAVRSATAVIEDVPVRSGGSFDFEVVRNGGQLELRNNGSPVASPACGLATRPPAIIFRNKTDRALRIIVQEPQLDVKGTKLCTPTCSTTPAAYSTICPPSPNSNSPCRPNEAMLALCGTPECDAIRRGCSGPGCLVDLFKVLADCGCSTARIAPKPATADAALQAKYGNLTLESVEQGRIETKDNQTTIYLKDDRVRSMADEDRAAVANLVGELANVKDVNIVAVVTGANQEVADAGESLVRFDPAMFAGTDGRASKLPYTFLIEEQFDAANPPTTDPLRLEWTFASGGACLTPTTAAATVRAAVVPLDNTGVASWRYLNPRNPACIKCDANGDALPATVAGPAGVVFSNRTSDRTFTVSVTLPKDAKISQAERDLFKCQPGKDCTVSRSIPPNNVTLFEEAVLSTFGRGVMRFEVGLLGETSTVSNPRAYLSLIPALDAQGKSQIEERASAAPLKTKLNVSGRVDPAYPVVPAKLSDTPGFVPCAGHEGDNFDPKIEPVLCLEHPYTGDDLRQYRGKGSLQLTPNLGDRAEGSVTLGIRNGTFGSTIDKVGLDEYQVTIFGTNGLSLKLGKADFLVPSSGIAVAESGEGFVYSFRNASLGHILRRESTAGTALEGNRDKKDWFFALRSITLGSRWRGRDRQDLGRSFLSLFRSFDAVVVRGEDKDLESTYETVGGEIYLALPSNMSKSIEAADGTTTVFNSFSGSVAAYRSKRRIDRDAVCRTGTALIPACRDGNGTVGLATLTWAPRVEIPAAGPTKTPHLFSFSYGLGSGDRPDTDTDPTDEGYIGETGSFSPDKLFFGSLLGKMNSEKVQYVAPGLSNKIYRAVTYTNNTFTLMDLIAQAIGVESDVNSKATILSYREYKLRYPRNGGRSAAREANATFQIEVPKGVTFSLELGWLEPGDAFEDIVKDDLFSIAAIINLTL
jgi:hypothetical protein